MTQLPGDKAYASPATTPAIVSRRVTARRSIGAIQIVGSAWSR